MPQASKLKVTLLVVLIAVASISVVKYVMWKKVKASAVATARQRGNPQAPIKIIEYVDLQCPACAYGALQIHQYLDRYPDKIFLEVKFFPLGGHVHSLTATKFARCAADKGKFWQFFEMVFKDQRRWSELIDAQPAFVEMIKGIGLNPDGVIACTAKDELRTKILAEKDAGTSLGIKSTPTYFINGTMFVGVKTMMDEIDRILGVKTTPVPQTNAGNATQLPVQIQKMRIEDLMTPAR